MTGESRASAGEALRELAEDYWEGVLRRTPTLATFFGDHRYNDRLPDIGPAGRAEEEADLRLVLARLEPLRAARLDDEDRITWDMLRMAVQVALDAVRLRLDEMAVDQMDGPQVWLPEMLNWHPTDTPEHVAQLIARYRAFDGYMDQYIGNLRDGIGDGRTAPTIAVERVIAQLKALLSADADEAPFSAPAKVQSPPLADELRRAVAESVYPAYQRMFDFLAGPDGYLERHARRDPGVWSVTDGEEIYALLVRQHTTTELTPAELHQLGRDDLASIHQEMLAIIARQGEREVSVREFTARLIRESSNLPASGEEIVKAAERLLAEAQAALPRVVNRLPKTPIVVKPVEEYRERDMPAAFYFQPSADGSRPATFYVNTFDPKSRPLHTLPALVFHESLPGHHLQIALAQEAHELPAFRRLSAGWLANAFVEGWALYTERLADELGLYPNELARFGMLGYQAWRACRLVVDTGLHHLRWSREQALEFFYENVGLSERETVNEVDRYIVWPGQALAYKVGQREIEALRREQEQRFGVMPSADGTAFDLRAFHDAVLGHAAVPLSTLRRIVQGDKGRQASSSG